MVFGKLFYIFFVLAILLAVGWNLAADQDTKPILMRLFVIALGLSMGCLALQGIVRKEVRLGPGRPLVRRDHNPFNYWGIILFTCVLAVVLLGVGFFAPV